MDETKNPDYEIDMPLPANHERHEAATADQAEQSDDDATEDEADRSQVSGAATRDNVE